MTQALAIFPHAYTPDYTAFDGSLFDRYIDYTSVRETTLKGYLTCIRAFMRWMNANGIKQPSRLDIKAYERFLAGSGYRSGTQAQYLRAVKHFFKWTAAEGLYPNIADNIKGAKVQHTQHKRDAFTIEEADSIANTIDRNTAQGKRIYAIYMLCVRRGLRTIEISRLNIEHIHIKNGYMYIDVWGKGHSEADCAKYIDPDTAEAVSEYLKTRGHTAPGDPLFISTSNRNKNGRMLPTTVSTLLKDVLKEAGYNSQRLTAHSLRHTAITAAAQNGDLYGAQQFAGHQDPKTTEIYMHIDDAEKEKALVMRIYNAYHKKQCDPREEAHAIIDKLTPDKLEKALAVLRAMA